jgi:Flp pilus assembly CpaE family ATPase
VASSTDPPGAEQPPSILQQRVRILEMSSVFAELSDGALRALARRMKPVHLAAGDTLRLGTLGGDAVVFLFSGLVEQWINDGKGKTLITRRPSAGDLVILPAPRSGARYVTSIRSLSDAVLLTLDQDALLQGLGPDVEKVAIAVDKLWQQELNAAGNAEFQSTHKIGAPVVAFFSAKGGSGVSTLAVNTAAVLAARYPRQVLLVDLSAPFGHAALYADLIATGSIAGASRAATGAYEKTLRGAVSNHKTGLGVLPGTLRPEEVDLMTGEVTGRAVDVACTWSKVVVADLGTSLAEASLAVIERAQCIVVIVPPEIAAMTDARRALAVFRDIMNVPDNKIELILNQRASRPPLDKAAVESILGRQMAVTIGYDGSKPEEATLAGGLVLQRDPSSLVSRGANEIARVILGTLKLDA